MVVRRLAPDVAGDEPPSLARHSPDAVGGVLEVTQHQRDLRLVGLGQYGKEVFIHSGYSSTGRPGCCSRVEGADRERGQRAGQERTTLHRSLQGFRGPPTTRERQAVAKCPVLSRCTFVLSRLRSCPQLVTPG